MDTLGDSWRRRLFKKSYGSSDGIDMTKAINEKILEEYNLQAGVVGDLFRGTNLLDRLVRRYVRKPPFLSDIGRTFLLI